jgi:hypothetical protein
VRNTQKREMYFVSEYRVYSVRSDSKREVHGFVSEYRVYSVRTDS